MSIPSKSKSHPVSPRPEDAALDFDPAQSLENSLSARRPEEGITIDPSGTRIIDDGLWIRPISSGWVVKTHIADAAAIIPDNSEIENVARLRKADQDGRRQIVRMFPGTFLDKYVSLHEGEERPAITFRIELDRNACVKNYSIYQSAFRSRQQCDYSPLRTQFNLSKNDYQGWKELARTLVFKRQNKLAVESDNLMNKASGPRPHSAPMMLENDIMRTLVHEAMLLTNTLATDFFKKKGVLAPTKVRGMSVNPISMTPDYKFDQACNKKCWDVLNHLVSNTEAHVRLTSPMRNFRDYVALKVMGRVLSGQKITPELSDDVRTFSETFNTSAQGHQDFTLSSGWRQVWARRFEDGKSQHPFQRILADGGMKSQAGQLAGLCRQRGWKWPRVAERELMLQGTRLYFAGMNFLPPNGKGPERQTWAVSYDPDMALEMVSRRMLDIIQPTGTHRPHRKPN